MATLRIAVLPGDGVGPEVIDGALAVLHRIADLYGHDLERSSHDVGWAASTAQGDPLPADTLAACHAADAVLLGAVGDPASEGAPPEKRPEAGLLRLRAELGCYANLRPVRVSDSLVAASALRPEVVRGTDLVIVRELAGGLYYGEPRGWDREGGRAMNTLAYTDDEVRRIARVAFELARERSSASPAPIGAAGGATPRPLVTSVDKANVLEVSRLWRATVDEVGADYPDVAHEHMLVDRAAMELVLRPTRFDIVLTENLFGDVLSDEGAALTGSLGILGSASLGGTTDLYEPVHGSAPDIAGHDLANPIGAIASVALMLRHTFGLREEAGAIESAVERTLAEGHRTPDLAREGAPSIGTRSFAAAVVERVGAPSEAVAGSAAAAAAGPAPDREVHANPAPRAEERSP